MSQDRAVWGRTSRSASLNLIFLLLEMGRSALTHRYVRGELEEKEIKHEHRRVAILYLVTDIYKAPTMCTQMQKKKKHTQEALGAHTVWWGEGTETSPVPCA